MRHLRFEKLAVDKALGILGQAQARSLQKHLDSGCVSCRDFSAELLDMNESLALAAEPKQPRPEIEKQLLKAIRAKKSASGFNLESFFAWAWRPALAGTFAVVLLVLGVHWFNQDKLQSQAGVLIMAQGNVLIDGKAAAEGAVLADGSIISSAKGAQAKVRFGDRAVFWIKGKSSVKLVLSKGHLLLEMTDGWLLQVVKHGVEYAVRTPLGSAHAHGTVFLAKVESPQEVYFCICKDRLDVEAQGISRSVASQHHAAMELSTESGSLKFELVKPKDHTDQDVALLEADLK